MTTRSRNKKAEEENVPFVKNIEMRANRGSKIKNLLDKKAQESDSDDFWKNNKYFGSFNDVMNESEDSEEYSQEADVPDVFDEDFGAESDSDEDEDEDEEEGLQGKKKAGGIQIFKKPEADVKKFIEKDEKKTKMTPAVAALKRTTARNKAKAEAEAKAKAKAKAKAEEAKAKAEAEAKAKAEAEAETAVAAEKASTKRTPTPVKKAPTPVKRVPTPDKKETPKASPAKIETTVRTGSTRIAAKAAERAKAMEAEAKEPSPPKVETKTITFVVNAAKKSQKQVKVTLEAIIPLKTTKAKTTKAAVLKPSKASQAKTTIIAATPNKGSKGKTMEIEQSSEPESVSMSTRGGQEKRNAMAKPAPKVPTFKKPTKGSRVNPKQEVSPAETPNKKKGKYIHDFYSQEELMKEAALTEIYNKKSLDSLLQIEADQKDSYLVVRRLEIDEPSVKYVSKKVNDQEQRYLVLSDNKARQLYFGNMLTSSSTNLNKRPLPEETPEEVEDMDETDIVRKKLFITNAKYKLAEVKRNLQKMEAEEEKIDKQLEVLKDLLQKKIKHLKS